MGINLKSFKGITYNPEKVKIENVVTPPYDVITPEEQENFYKKSEYNIVRLILGKKFETDNDGNNRYTRAKEFYQKWLKEKVLIKDKKENIYYLEENFEINGKSYTREGFIAIVKLEEFEKGNILPHEKTLKGPKIDRFNLIKECKVNFSQIFGLYSDSKLRAISMLKEYACSTNPYFNFFFNDINYKFWKFSDQNLISKIQELMAEKKIFIADGHHRYETALAYRDFMRKKLNIPNNKEMPFDYIMFYLCPMEDKGLIVLPTHRLLKNISINLTDFLEKSKKYFEIKELKDKNLEKLIHLLESKKEENTVFIFFNGKNFYLFELKDNLKNLNKLDVEILEEFIFKKILNITDEEISNKKKIDFIKDTDRGIKAVIENKFSGIFIMNPTKIDQIKQISLNKGILPQKSTYFYPKLLTGLVIYSLE